MEVNTVHVADKRTRGASEILGYILKKIVVESARCVSRWFGKGVDSTRAARALACMCVGVGVWVYGCVPLCQESGKRER